MAREVVVRIKDDLNRDLVADEVCELGWDGFIYILDLTAEHAEQLRELIQPYLDVAHNRIKIPKKLLPRNDALPDEMKSPRGLSGGTTAKANAVPDKELRHKIRSWGRENGYQVSPVGVIPGDVTSAYFGAHGIG